MSLTHWMLIKAPAHYNFGYAVKDGYYSDFGHSEQRHGDKTVGNYYVNLPHGSRQVVNYYVDKYQGQPGNHYTYKPHYQPSYHHY